MITMAITFVFPDVSPNPKSAATYPAAPNATAAIVTRRAQA